MNDKDISVAEVFCDQRTADVQHIINDHDFQSLIIKPVYHSNIIELILSRMPLPPIIIKKTNETVTCIKGQEIIDTIFLVMNDNIKVTSSLYPNIDGIYGELTLQNRRKISETRLKYYIMTGTEDSVDYILNLYNKIKW